MVDQTLDFAQVLSVLSPNLRLNMMSYFNSDKQKMYQQNGINIWNAWVALECIFLALQTVLQPFNVSNL